MTSLELEGLRAQFARKSYAVEEVAASDPQAVAYALDTPSLFGEGRFVIVRGMPSEVDRLADRLAEWAASPPPGIAACVVADRAPKLRKAAGARADVIEPRAPKPWETADWLVRHVKSHGRVMRKDAAEALVDAIGGELRDLATAAEQLMLATTGAITREVVQRLFRGFESQLYSLLDSVLARDRSAGLKHLSALLRAGEPPLVILQALARQFRALAAARDAAKMPAEALARELRLPAGHVKRAFRHGRNFDTGEIRSAFRMLAEADLALKGGETGFEDQPGELTLELLVSEICGDARPAPAASRRR